MAELDTEYGGQPRTACKFDGNNTSGYERRLSMGSRSSMCGCYRALAEAWVKPDGRVFPVALWPRLARADQKTAARRNSWPASTV